MQCVQSTQIATMLDESFWNWRRSFKDTLCCCAFWFWCIALEDTCTVQHLVLSAKAWLDLLQQVLNSRLTPSYRVDHCDCPSWILDQALRCSYSPCVLRAVRMPIANVCHANGASWLLHAHFCLLWTTILWYDHSNDGGFHFYQEWTFFVASVSHLVWPILTTMSEWILAHASDYFVFDILKLIVTTMERHDKIGPSRSYWPRCLWLLAHDIGNEMIMMTLTVTVTLAQQLILGW